MSSVGVMTCPWDDCDRENLSPQGYTAHVTYCDHNPEPGIPRSKQQELGMIETDGNDWPSPDEPESPTSPSLPPREEPEITEEHNDDDHRTCPVCDHGDVMDAEEAKAEYLSSCETVHPKAKKGYELADHACQNPHCGALWGDEYAEPLPMEVIINA